MIELRAVQREFAVGDQIVHALRDIDLTVQPGEYLSLMGPSGSGKSTLLNVIGLLDRPSSGTFLLDGVDTGTLDDEAQARARREKVGFVFQSFHLIPRLTAAQNIEMPLVLAGVAPSERKRRTAEQLEAFGLTDRGHHLPEQLSGGQRQRTAIARATITHPEVVLADEPTGNLDRATGDEVVKTLERLQDEGLSLIVVTHDPALGARADRQLRLEDGRIVRDVRKAPGGKQA